MSSINKKPIALGQGRRFEYVAHLTALDSGTYNGWTLRCDVVNGGVNVHDFGAVVIEPQEDGTGMAILSANTDLWPIETILSSDILILDGAGETVTRSKVFTIEITNGITDKVTTV